MEVGRVAPNHYKILCLYSLFPTLLCNYLYILLLYTCIYLSFTFTWYKFAKRDHYPIHPPSRVITIGWISLIFLTILVGSQALPTLLKVIAYRKDDLSLIVHSPKCPWQTQGELMDTTNPPICQQSPPPSDTLGIRTRDLNSNTACRTSDATNSPKSNCL